MTLPSRPRRPTPLWYMLTAILMSTLAVSGAGIWYTHHAQRDSDRRWCGVVTVLDDRFRAAPPTEPASQEMAAEIAQLRDRFGCPPPE